MKRDWDLIREILLELEKKVSFHDHCEVELAGREFVQITYHIKLLAEAGLIDAQNWSSKDGPNWVADCLTWRVHEFLDAIRSETIWLDFKTRRE